MTFLAGSRLWLLLAVPLLIGGYVLLQRRRRGYVVRFTNLNLLADVAPRRPGWRRHVAPALLLLSIAMLIGAVARPAVSARVPREQASVVLVLDISRSMSATDLKPDRMTAAKQAAIGFVRSSPAQLRIGVAAFTNTAALIAPLGRDRAATEAALASLEPISGTAVGDGLAVALDEILRQREGGRRVPASVLLLSDGVSNQGRPPIEAAQQAASEKVPVYTVGIGSDGATLDVGGRIVPVDLNEEDLRAIAETTGGTYFRTADANALKAVYRDLGSKLGYERERREATATAAGVAMVLLLAGAGASMLWFQRIP